MNIICGVYKITSPTNRVYIGQSSDIEKRWRVYKSLSSNVKRQKVLYNSFLKHGVENHIFELIEECNFYQLNKIERHWQDFYNVLNGGLNCKLQSDKDKKMVLSEEARNSISKANSKEGNGMYGLKGDNFPYKKFFGSDNPRFGCKHTEITKNKMREAHKKANKKIIKGKEHPLSKKVIDEYTNKIYSSVREASENVGINYHTLQKKLSGAYKNTTTLKYLIND